MGYLGISAPLEISTCQLHFEPDACHEQQHKTGYFAGVDSLFPDLNTEVEYQCRFILES